jgi:hypothetical protein
MRARAAGQAEIEANEDAGKRPSRIGKRAVNFYLPPDVWNELKMEAARQNFRPVQQIMEELVAEYLARRKGEGTKRRG